MSPVLSSDDYFSGKRVVLFALPGAFTPTCSSSHLPGYEKAYDDIKKEGIDEVYCLSVNDVSIIKCYHGFSIKKNRRLNYFFWNK